jgi:hypothetical protein
MLSRQQPFGQLSGPHVGDVHVWSTQVSSLLQTSQAAPPVPQLALDVPARQTPSASQQPFGQLTGVHVIAWQVPPPAATFTQVVPAPQGAQAAPPVPQLASERPDWQTPFRQQPEQLPGLQVLHVPLSHVPPAAEQFWQIEPLAPQVVLLDVWQTPVAEQHWFAAPQAWHVAPLTPQKPPAPFVVHVPFTLPVQQPAGQLVASQTH